MEKEELLKRSCYVKRAKEYVEDKLAICTVIGFPNRNMTTAAKVFETEDAETFLALGADRLGTSRLIQLLEE